MLKRLAGFVMAVMLFAACFAVPALATSSNYDPNHPEIYLEITRSSENADAVAASVSETLSKDYDVGKDSVTLDQAGPCIRLDASSDKTGHTPDFMQAVYIFPATDGCRIATIHYTFDSADGFGVRFRHFINSIIVITGQDG